MNNTYTKAVITKGEFSKSTGYKVCEKRTVVQGSQRLKRSEIIFLQTVTNALMEIENSASKAFEVKVS